MFLYSTDIGKKKEIIQRAVTRIWNLFHLSEGGRKCRITGPRPLSFAAPGRLQNFACELHCCQRWLWLPTRTGSFLIPGTDSRLSAPVHPKSVCVFLPPRVTLPTCCHCCHLLGTGGIQQPYSTWNKFQLPNFYSSLNFDFIIANKLLLIPLFHILSLYEESFLIAVRDTKADFCPWTFPKSPISNKSDTLLLECMSK